MKKTGKSNNRRVYVNKGRKTKDRRTKAVTTAISAAIIVLSTAVIIGAVFLYDKYTGGEEVSSESLSKEISSEETSSEEYSSEEYSSEDISVISESSSQTISVPSVTDGPVFFGVKNPLLKGNSINDTLKMGSVAGEVLPSSLGFTSVIYKGKQVLESFARQNSIQMYDPYDYAGVAGILTFRGNNFRNGASFGYADIKEKKVEQIWERSMGGMASSSWSFSWSGTGWTGQPVMVQWDEEVRLMMDLYPEKKNKEGLVEVITASMDGYIYFYDLSDGKDTRPPIRTGIAVKGTPAIDPRGYPILYVGQGDYPPNKPGGEMGFRIFDLINNELMYFHNTGKETRSYRNGWGAQDSSPIIDAKSDTLIYPCENGMIYTGKLNTVFDKANKKVSIDPEFVDYKYKSSATTSQGIESSVAIYGSYAYFSDNSGTLNCVDLDTMEPMWSRRLDDDNDVTPTLQQEGDDLFLYCGTEVDNQRGIKGTYKGDAFVYKINALTGDIVWRNSYPAYTYNDPGNAGNDINGGIMGSMVVGKGKYSDLVIASVCMTEGYSSGNTIAAFDTATGDLVWDYKMNHYSWGSPVDVYDSKGNMYIVMTDSVSQIHLVDGDDGSRLHYIQIKRNFDGAEPVSGGNIESSAAVFGDLLVVGSRGGVLAGVRLR